MYISEFLLTHRSHIGAPLVFMQIFWGRFRGDSQRPGLSHQSLSRMWLLSRELLASAERQTLFSLRMNGLEAESHDEPFSSLPMWTAGGEARRSGLHADVFVTESQSGAESPPHDRPRGGESEANDLWRSLPESLQRLWENDRTDGLVTHSQMTGWRQEGGGVACGIPGDGWCRGMQRIRVMN